MTDATRPLVFLGAAALGAVLLLLTAGCVGGPGGRFGPDPLERYLRLNPQVTAPMRDALREGRIMQGMNRQEVRLCMGPPQRKETVGDAGAGLREIWLYHEPVKKDILRGSQLWHTDIPMARVVFGTDGRVENWHFFSSEKPFRPEVYIDAGARAAALNPAAQSAPYPPSPSWQPGPKGAFEDWPMLQLTGISHGGQEPTAILNRQVVSVGDSVDGVRVLAVLPEGVWLRYRNSDQFLPLR